MDGVSVYESRLLMGEKLAYKIMDRHPDHDIDVVIPIPDTSRTSALQLAYILGRPFREGFIKNRYIARTFIMPGQATRKKSVRLKLNTIKSEFEGRNVLLVDDSVVRGTTAHEIIDMARDAGAKKVYFASAAPPIRYPNIYGIDIPTRNELVAYERNDEQIAQNIGCDWIVYQDTDDLVDAVKECCDPNIPLTGEYRFILCMKLQIVDRNDFNVCFLLILNIEFDTSCFTGSYVTGETIECGYFKRLHELRNDSAQELRRLGKIEITETQPVLSGGDGGCESVHNDQSAEVVDAARGCEAI
jgi:amidophosphoribosyltransferase